MFHSFTHGWNRQPKDARDRKFAAPPPVDVETAVLLKGMPPVWDQCQLGSCTAHGSLAAFAFCDFQPGAATQALSRLQVYYDTRAMEGTADQDSGGNIRDAVKVLATNGAAPESLWPYDVGRFAAKPPDAVYAAAKRLEALEYRAVNETVLGVKGALALGLPVIIGFDVSSNFMDIGSDGLMALPSGEVEGGHCVCVIGYSDRDYQDGSLGHIPSGTLIVRNSWGPDWGRKGHFLMPYEALEACSASDFWVVSQIIRNG